MAAIEMTLYADDMSLYRCIETPQDYQKLQNDINYIVEWISVNHLCFNVTKCKSMLISRKRNPLQRPVLSLCGEVLEQVECFKYLGVLLTSDLTWSKHTESIYAKAKKLLGMI